MVLPALVPMPAPLVTGDQTESLRLRDYALTLALRSPWFRGRLLRERLVMLVGADPWVEGYRVLVAEAGGELHQFRESGGLHRLVRRLTWGDLVVLSPAVKDQAWLLQRLHRTRATVLSAPESGLSTFSRLLRRMGSCEPEHMQVAEAASPSILPTPEAVRADFVRALAESQRETQRQPLAGRQVLVVGTPVLMPDYRLLVEGAGGQWAAGRPDLVLRAPDGGLAAFERMMQAMFFRSR